MVSIQLLPGQKLNEKTSCDLCGIKDAKLFYLIKFELSMTSITSKFAVQKWYRYGQSFYVSWCSYIPLLP